MKRTKSLSMREMRNLRSIVYEKTGYYIKNRSLLVQAFTRSSYSAQCGGENNEVLEFIGDRVLDYYVVKAIAERYGYVKTQRNVSFDGDCEYSFKGHARDFTELKKKIVSNETLACKIDAWNLTQYMIVGKCDINNQVADQVKIKADLFEAILGAVAVASQWNPKVLQNVVEKMLQIEDYLMEIDGQQYKPEHFSVDNAVSTLKELSEQGRCSVPVYEYGSPEDLGYDENGNPRWVCTCKVAEWALIRQVWASSKKLAKKYAAYLILCDHFEFCNEYGENGAWLSWRYENGKLQPSHKVDAGL